MNQRNYTSLYEKDTKQRQNTPMETTVYKSLPDILPPKQPRRTILLGNCSQKLLGQTTCPTCNRSDKMLNEYSGDRNSEHLNNKLLFVHFFPFRCPVIVSYSSRDLNSKLKVCLKPSVMQPVKQTITQIKVL